MNELWDGNVLVRPGPTPRHQMIIEALAGALRVGRGNLNVLVGVTVRLSEQRMVIPDIVVAGPIDLDSPVVDASAVRLVVEVVSPASETLDTTLKMRGYAEAGIPWYLLVEQDSQALRGHYLVGGAYQEQAVLQLEQLLTNP